MIEFVACASCARQARTTAALSESPELEAPALCKGCQSNRAAIDKLRRENEALIDVYVLAARLRTFPVLFDDHFALVGAVDECRSVLEPPIDHYAASTEAPSAWQEHVAAYPREEFLAAFREAHATLHRLWTATVGKEGYHKSDWKALDNALARFARDAAEKAGISRSEPLL